jgi:hypothetical protein
VNGLVLSLILMAEGLAQREGNVCSGSHSKALGLSFLTCETGWLHPREDLRKKRTWWWEYFDKWKCELRGRCYYLLHLLDSNLFPRCMDLLIVACWRKLSLSNYCPSSACLCVLCSQPILTLTPDAAVLCRASSPVTLCPAQRGRSPRLWEAAVIFKEPKPQLCGQSHWGEARAQVLQTSARQRLRKCHSHQELGPAANRSV